MSFYMGRKTPIQKEWKKLEKLEEKLLEKRLRKQDSLLNQKLQEKIPEKLQDTLATAFEKAFTVIFNKGTGIIEKTYCRENIEKNYQINQYAAEIKQDRKTLRSFSKSAKTSGTKNFLLSGISGIGMGVLGIGIPDIPVFTGMVLKSIYETALHYGFGYETEEEKYFILLLIQGALSSGEYAKETERKILDFLDTECLPEEYDEKLQIRETANCLSQELLYMKFIQGIPVVGMIGGAYDAYYMKQITEYANLKYCRRFLLTRKGQN